jgi:hypothetical protein
MNPNLDNQEYLNEDIILTIKDEKFYLRLQNLELLVKGDDFNSAYHELIQKKNARLTIMKELNLNIPPSRLKGVSNPLFSKQFFFKMVVATVSFLSIIGFTKITLDEAVESGLNQFRSIVQLAPDHLNRLKNINPIHILENALHKEAVKNPIEPERQEKIIKDLRVVVHRLKPFLEEIRPLFKSEKLKSL